MSEENSFFGRFFEKKNKMTHKNLKKAKRMGPSEKGDK